MSWVDVVFAGINVANQISISQQLEEQRMQGATAAVLAAIEAQAKNEIFKYNFGAQQVLASNAPIKLAAAALSLLQAQLSGSGIKREMFSQIADKQYFEDTISFIRENTTRLKSQLSSVEISEIDSVVYAVQELPKYDYYLENHSKLLEYTKALPLSTGSPGFIRFLGTIFVLGGGFIILAALCVASILERGLLFTSPGWIISVVAIAVGWYLISSSGKNIVAKKVTERVRNEVDVQKLSALDKEFNSDAAIVQELKIKAESQIRNFFGDVDMKMLAE